jgi:hypothetical protein
MQKAYLDPLTTILYTNYMVTTLSVTFLGVRYHAEKLHGVESFSGRRQFIGYL